MLRSILSSFLTLTLLLPHFTWAKEAKRDELQELMILQEDFKKSCLPEDIKESRLERYFRDEGLSVDCWKLLAEIQEKEKYIEKELKKKNCESGACEDGELKESTLALSLDLDKKPALLCTPQKKLEIKKACATEAKCVLSSGILPLFSVFSSLKTNNCDPLNDNCFTQIVTSFFKGGVVFFEGLFHLVKLGVDYTKDKIQEFWKDLTKAEDHSSMAQITLAQASEDPGFFEELKKDFPRTMNKLWEAFLESVKEWLKTDVFCEKWSGKPHFSQCLSSAPGFDCIGCKNLFTGMCSIMGYVSSEIIPAFFMGGAITAAKHGVKAAGEIAKKYKIPEYTRKVLVTGPLKVVKETSEVASKIPGVRVTALTVQNYFLHPTVKLTLKAREVFLNLIKTKPAQLVLKGGEETISFSYRVTSTAFKAVLYPIDNPMTSLAFESGSKGVEKVLKLGTPKLVTGSAILSNLIHHNPDMERLWIKLEDSRLESKIKPDERDRILFEIHEKLKTTRSKYLTQYLKKQTTSLDELIKYVYPELLYGKLAKKLPLKDVLKAEAELGDILKVSSSQKLFDEFNQRLSQSEERYRLLSQTQSPKDVLSNSALTESERKNQTMILLGKSHLPKDQQESLYIAVKEAHEVAPLHGVYQYTWREIREKQKILVKAGLTKKEAELVIRHGLAGGAPLREIIDPPFMLLNLNAESIMRKDFKDRETNLLKLFKKERPTKQSIEALYFIDYQDALRDLQPIFRNKRELKESTFYDLYDEGAFFNYRQAKFYLDKENPDVSLDLLKTLHALTMKGGVEKVEAQNLGRVRSTQWTGAATEEKPITLSAVSEIKNNKYLTWNQTASYGNEKNTGIIFYPTPEVHTKEILYQLKGTHPDLVQKIERFNEVELQIRYIKLQLLKVPMKDAQAPSVLRMKERLETLKSEQKQLKLNSADLTEKFVTALTEYEIDLFKKQRAALGKLDTIEKFDKYVDIVASLQKNLVSIHPLPNGNGRSTRLLLNHLLNREGLPSARIMNTEGDLYRSHEEWRKAIKEGMLASDQLVDDLTERAKLGLPLENSMDLFLPQKRKISPVPLISESEVRTQQGLEVIDPRLMREVVKRELLKNPTLSPIMVAEPEKTWRELTEKTQEVFKKNNIYYEHPKKGIERVEIGFVDDDYRFLFGEPSYANKDLYTYKMKNWYSEQLSWRGYSSKTKVYSDDEILSHFTQINPNLVSNRTRAKIESGADPTEVKMAIERDFDDYNEDVFGTGLAKKAKEHALFGEERKESYALSTSKKREVAKAFSMGAMDLEKYGEHAKPEVQDLLKSRLIVGSRRAIKDVDLSRLKQVREDFSYDYGRQQEVLSIGAIEPDAVNIVQSIDAKGEVIKSFVRNPQNPREVFIIPKDIDQSLPINPADAERIVELP